MKYFFYSDLLPVPHEVSFEYALDFLEEIFPTQSRVDLEHNLTINRNNWVFQIDDRVITLEAEEGIDYGYCPDCRGRIDYFNIWCRCTPRKSFKDAVTSVTLKKLHPPKPFTPKRHGDN